MALLNYTTKIDPIKTAGEIEYSLIKHGATSILKNIIDGRIDSISFMIKTQFGELPIKLPINIEPVLEILKQQKKTNSTVKPTYEQAERTAWRILKDWVEAQMAIYETNMVKMEQIFMPYIIKESGQTLFEEIEQKQFKQLLLKE